MARIGESGDLRKCSFCGRGQRQVNKLVAGPGVYICDNCIDLCCELMDDMGVPPSKMRASRIDLAYPLPIWIDEVNPADDKKLCETRAVLEEGLSRLNKKAAADDVPPETGEYP